MPSSDGYSTFEWQTGQRSGRLNLRSLPVRRSRTGPSTCGITSPARVTSTQSPSRMSFASIRSKLWSVAVVTVTPPISTGSSTAYGLSAPVRPTLIRISLSLVIRINVGRTGALNPYAVLEPVEIGGVTVTTATLHNFDLIEAKDIREGDWVEVTRAGEVIPQVLGPVRERRTGKEHKFKRPERCPVCHSKVEYPSDEVMAYCSNVSCPGRILESIVHFAAVMDIRGLGYERVRALLDAKLIKDVADLYELTPAQLLKLQGFAEKSAQQLVDAIQASKRQPLSTLLSALGIRHVGAQVAKLLARRFGTMKALRNASVEEISKIRGVGMAIAEAVAGFFDETKNRKLLERLEKLGLNFTEPTVTEGKGPLAGQTYVVTGTLPSLSRTKAAELIEAAGGHVADSVSKKTTALVVGADAGSKFEKAKALGIPIIDEAELLRRARAKP